MASECQSGHAPIEDRNGASFPQTASTPEPPAAVDAYVFERSKHLKPFYEKYIVPILLVGAQAKVKIMAQALILNEKYEFIRREYPEQLHGGGSKNSYNSWMPYQIGLAMHNYKHGFV